MNRLVVTILAAALTLGGWAEEEKKAPVNAEEAKAKVAAAEKIEGRPRPKFDRAKMEAQRTAQREKFLARMKERRAAFQAKVVEILKEAGVADEAKAKELAAKIDEVYTARPPRMAGPVGPRAVKSQSASVEKPAEKPAEKPVEKPAAK